MRWACCEVGPRVCRGRPMQPRFAMMLYIGFLCFSPSFLGLVPVALSCLCPQMQLALVCAYVLANKDAM